MHLALLAMCNLYYSTFNTGGILLFKSAYKTKRGVFLKLWQIVPPWYMIKIGNKL